MDGLIRKKDLIDAVGVAKSTIADWVTEFSVFIPTVKHGAITYYRPEAIDVLNCIKELRQLDYAKHQIMEMLSKRGFPITVEEAVEDVQRVLSHSDPRDTLLNVMQKMGQTVAEIGKQTERLNQHDEKLYSHEIRLDEQVDKVQQLENMVNELRRQLFVTNEELSAAIAREQEKKPLWKRLIGK